MSSQYARKSPSSSLSVAAFRSAVSFLSPPRVLANRASSRRAAASPTSDSTSDLCGTEIPVAPKPRASFTPVNSIVARYHSSSASGSPDSAANAAPNLSPSDEEAAIFSPRSRPAARPNSLLRSSPFLSSPTIEHEVASFPSTARIFAAGAHSSVLQNRIVESRLQVTARNGLAGCVAIAYTSARWRLVTCRHWPVTEFHVRTVLSQDPVKQISGISGCQAWPRTLDSWPSSVTGILAVYRPSGVSSKIFAVLSSETLMSRP
mmetsp:Transcript_782/g.3232  ORF Transcript_782/g.3232 Transcript_782/m.3232 type:complete len:262 (-) Transcript_782:1770-2555(-)